MANIGMNVDREGNTPASVLLAKHNTLVRIVMIPPPNSGLTRVIEYAEQGLMVLGVLAQESFPDYIWKDDSKLAAALKTYNDTYGPYLSGIQVGNEPDHVSDSSWTLNHEELFRLTEFVDKYIDQNIPRVLGGLASGQPAWLDGFDFVHVDAVAIHPYLKDGPNDSDIEDLPDVTSLLDAYEEYTGTLPIMITEWGWWGDKTDRGVDEIYDMVRWASESKRIAGFFYFCYSDAMVPPFGLYNADGSPKEDYVEAFVDAAAGTNNSTFWISGGGVTTPDLVEYAKARARVYGVDQDIFYKQIKQESQFNPKAYNNASGATGIAQIIPSMHPDVDPTDPRASLDYAAKWLSKLLKTYNGSYVKALAAYNWGPGNVNSWNGSYSDLPEETRLYLTIILGEEWDAGLQKSVKVTYNPDEPVHPQDKSYDCSQESLEWGMWSVNRHPQDKWMEDTMSAEGVMNSSSGLLDASGKGLADFITRQWGEFGFYGHNEPVVSYEYITREAGEYPILAGFRRWGSAGHWTGVRGYDEVNNRLNLANPANGYDGIYQTMTEQQFRDRGPVSMVRILHPDLLISSDTEEPTLSTPDREGYETAIKHIVNVIIPGIVDKTKDVQELVAEANRIKKQFTGEE